MDLIDLIGFAGAGVVLAAYALTNARSFRVTPKTLAGMNLGAGAALALNGLVHHAWPSTVVNTVWFVIAAVALWPAAALTSAASAGAGLDAARPSSSSNTLDAPNDARIVRSGHDGASGGYLLLQHPDDPIDRRLVLLRRRLVQQQQLAPR